MKKIVAYSMALIFLVGISVYANSLCNINDKSSLFQQWKLDWGEYEWGDNAQINQYYIVETNGVVKDMMQTCDIMGLKQMLNYLGKNEIVTLQNAEGSYLDNILQENINPLVVSFLLENKLILKELHLTIKYKQLANQKLQEAKAKGDSKAIANYEKILEILKEYSVK
ncbi:hypothetical protein [Helicobacter typhlonius]|uniref:hypothetical protein n=1 Tax=Helicobacter typhlonius TaxID=76936 RepID=UPI0026122F5C|nr:hypothetical protein [uncultured Helicobacter sp.]